MDDQEQPYRVIYSDTDERKGVLEEVEKVEDPIHTRIVVVFTVVGDILWV